MTRRWHPAGRGWIRTLDYGNLAIWMRPEADGLSIAVYAGGGFGHLPPHVAETWIVRVGRHSAIPHLIMDKPHRIRWTLDHSGDHTHGAVHIHRTQRPASHRGHRRLNPRRDLWRWPLPLPIRRALRETP